MSLPELTGTPIHNRHYQVAAYYEGSDRLRLRGSVQDVKPPGTYFPGDPDPLTVHHMVVDLLLDYPSLTIVAVAVEMQTTPHLECVHIEQAYQGLVGLSIARGFSRQVKDLFGGPRGCTHVGALLQAMAPVAIQSTWSMQSIAAGGINRRNRRRDMTREERERSLAFNLNTCHIWDAEGEQVAQVLAGEELEPPLWAQERLVQLGRNPEQWAD